MEAVLQISESFNRFGVTAASQHLLVACFDAKADQVSINASCTHSVAVMQVSTARPSETDCLAA